MAMLARRVAGLLCLLATAAVLATAAEPKPSSPPPPSPPAAGRPRKNVSATDLSVSEFMHHMLAQVVMQQKHDVEAMRAVQVSCSDQEHSYEAQLTALNREVDHIEQAMAARNASLRALTPLKDVDARISTATKTVEGLRAALTRARALFHVSKAEEVEFNKTITELYGQLQKHWSKYQEDDSDDTAAAAASAPPVSNVNIKQPESRSGSAADKKPATAPTTTAAPSVVNKASALMAAGVAPVVKAVNESGVGRVDAAVAPAADVMSNATGLPAIAAVGAGVMPVPTANASGAGALVNNASGTPATEGMNDVLSNAAPNGTASAGGAVPANSFLELQSLSSSSASASTSVANRRSRMGRRAHLRSLRVVPAANASNATGKAPATVVIKPPPHMVTPTIISGPVVGGGSSNGGVVGGMATLVISRDLAGQVASAPSGGLPTQGDGGTVVAVGTVTEEVVPQAAVGGVVVAASASNSGETSTSPCAASCMPTCSVACVNVAQVSPARVVGALQSAACAPACMPGCNPTCGAIQSVSILQPPPQSRAQTVMQMSAPSQTPLALAVPSQQQSPPPAQQQHVLLLVGASNPPTAPAKTVTMAAPSTSSSSSVSSPTTTCVSTCMPICAAVCVSKQAAQPAGPAAAAGTSTKVGPGSAVVTGPAVVTLGGGSPGGPAAPPAAAAASAAAVQNVGAAALAAAPRPATVVVSQAAAPVPTVAVVRSSTNNVQAPPRFAETHAVVTPGDVAHVHASQQAAAAVEAEGAGVQADDRRMLQRTRTTREGSVTVLAGESAQAQELVRSSTASAAAAAGSRSSSSRGGGGSADSGDGSSSVVATGQQQQQMVSATQAQAQRGVVIHSQQREVIDTATAAESHDVAAAAGRLGVAQSTSQVGTAAPTGYGNSYGFGFGHPARAGPPPTAASGEPAGVHVHNAGLASEPLSHAATNGGGDGSGGGGGAGRDSARHVDPTEITNLRTSLGKLVNRMDALADEAADTTDRSLERAYSNYGAAVESDFLKAQKRLRDLVALRARNQQDRTAARSALAALSQQRADVVHAAAPVVNEFNHTATACRIYLDRASTRAAKRQGLIDAVLGVSASFAEASGIAAQAAADRTQFGWHDMPLPAAQAAGCGGDSAGPCQAAPAKTTDCSCLSYYLYGASHSVSMRCCPAAYRLYDLQAVSSVQKDALRLLPVMAQGKY